jgi:uncharacterized repeat protein (TIGR01451 family)
VTIDTIVVYSNPVEVGITVPYLAVRKTADINSVSTGDIVVYNVEVDNLSENDTLYSVMIRDLMPHGFGFVTGSARLDGVAIPPDSLNGRDIAWSIGSLAPESSTNLSYRLVVGTGAVDGTGSNIATATALSGGGAVVAAEPSRASVVVRQGPFTGDEIILGRAWVDVNENGLHDIAEPPVPGVILLMENGTRVIADAAGRFSIPEVQTGTHVLRLLDHGIPDGLVPVSLGTRSSGDAWTRFVELSPFGMAKANFPFRVVKREPQYLEATLERTIRALDPVPHWWDNAYIEHATVYFDIGSVELTDESVGLLDSLLIRMNAPCVRIISVSGHADSVRISEAFADNAALSLARADAVKEWILTAGVDSTHIIARAFGEERPAGSNLTHTGRATNRRVEIAIVCLPETATSNWSMLTDSSVHLVAPEVRDLEAVVYFESGSDSLDQTSVDLLQIIATTLPLDRVIKVDLIGHSDTRSIRSTRFTDNAALSNSRAIAVKNLLVASGFDSTRFIVKGVGFEIPLESNKTDDSRMWNRRVEIIIEYMARCDTVKIERAEVTLSLQVSGVSDSTEFRVTNDLLPDIVVMTPQGLDSLPMIPGDSARAVLAHRGRGFDDLPDPVLYHPVWGQIPFQSMSADSIDSMQTRWSLRFEIPADSNDAVRSSEPYRRSVGTTGGTSSATATGSGTVGAVLGVANTTSDANIIEQSPEKSDGSTGLASGWIWEEKPSAIRYPKPGQLVWIESPLDSSLSYRDRLTVLAKGLAGTQITLKVNGVEIERTVVRPDSRADFLNVPAPAGPVLLTVSQELPNGIALRDSIFVHVIGPAARVTLDVARQALPADSLSQTEVIIRAYDQWGMPLRDNHIVNINLDHGSIITRDIYSEESGAQILLRDGKASVLISAPDKVGEGRLTASVGGVTSQTTLNYTTPFEKGIIIGVAEGLVGWKQSRSAPVGVTPTSDFDGGLYSQGRAAIFARGTVGDGYLLTTSYDSDRKFDDRVYSYLTPESSYPIYGDASSVAYEAPSASMLFARVEKDRSHAQYGDFSTNLLKTELAAYNRSFTGLSTAGQTENIDWNLFGASTGQSIQVDEIPGEGVSGHYYLSAAARGVSLVEGSERIVIQTRDRLHPETILREEVMYRFIDYEIDYRAGTLLFKRPVASIGSGESSVIIVATYETAQSMEHHTVAGGRVALHSDDQWEIGASLVGEERSDSDYWLTGLDAQTEISSSLLLSTEIARSVQDEQGWAWKVGAQSRGAERFDYDVYYRASDKSFYNPNSTAALPGLSKLRGRFSWSPTGSATVLGEGFHTRDAVNDESRSSTTLGGSYRVHQLTGNASMEVTTADRAGTSTQGAILTTGAEWAAARTLTLNAERQQNFLDEDPVYSQTLNRLQARWSPLKKVDFVAEHAFGDHGLMDSSYTLVGFQSRMSDNTTAYANYKLDNGINGQSNEAIVGLRNQLRLHSYVTASTSFERKMILRGSSGGEFYSYSVGAEYLPPEFLKASARFEKRDGNTLDKIVATTAGDFVIAQNLSLLTDYTYLDEQNIADTSRSILRSHEFRSGLAWRAHSNDFANVLAKYEYKNQFNSVVKPTSRRTVHIGSVEGIIEPRAQLEWYLRYAFKVASLSSEGLSTWTLTDLWMTSVRLEWNAQWDVLGEYRVISQHTVNDANHGFAAEVGRVLNRSARVAFGYNFTGYHDSDFAGTSYWAQGPYLKIQMKFTEAGVAGILHGLRHFSR